MHVSMPIALSGAPCCKGTCFAAPCLFEFPAPPVSSLTQASVHLPTSADPSSMLCMSGKYELSRDSLDCVAIFDGQCLRLERAGATILNLKCASPFVASCPSWLAASCPPAHRPALPSLQARPHGSSRAGPPPSWLRPSPCHCRRSSRDRAFDALGLC